MKRTSCFIICCIQLFIFSCASEDNLNEKDIRFIIKDELLNEKLEAGVRQAEVELKCEQEKGQALKDLNKLLDRQAYTDFLLNYIEEEKQRIETNYNYCLNNTRS